ncbi:MAG TPA: GNAT family N-acetyltransferase [Ilumatobacter sp.]|nr:GNAT family N-acetyltransferase [Ilumatobacter sp.]
MWELLTPRLQLRGVTPDDVDTLVACRSHPDVSVWLGSPPERAEAVRQFQQMAAASGPAPGAWYRASIVHAGTVVGDVGVGIRDGGGIAEIDGVLHPDHRGHGFAREAAAALVDDLVEHHTIHRIEANLAPRNIAAMRLLEAIGMTFEVVARDARCVDGVWGNELRYAMTSADRLAWRERPRGEPGEVELVEITADDVGDWAELATHYSERWFVDPMPITFMDALFPEEFEGVDAVPWMRGVVADGEPVAFVMTSENHGQQEGHFLWRMLVDRMHQRRGIGRRALVLMLDHLREQGVGRVFTSCGEGVGTPQPFYESLGFRPTGRMLDDEVELVIEL